MIIHMYCSTGCAVVIGSCSRIQLRSHPSHHFGPEPVCGRVSRCVASQGSTKYFFSVISSLYFWNFPWKCINFFVWVCTKGEKSITFNLFLSQKIVSVTEIIYCHIISVTETPFCDKNFSVTGTFFCDNNLFLTKYAWILMKSFCEKWEFPSFQIVEIITLWSPGVRVI